MATVSIACGFGCADDLGFVYFDAHADLDTPKRNLSGYLDVIGFWYVGQERLCST
jgi:arginase family enzyme